MNVLQTDLASTAQASTLLQSLIGSIMPNQASVASFNSTNQVLSRTDVDIYIGLYIYMYIQPGPAGLGRVSANRTKFKALVRKIPGGGTQSVGVYRDEPPVDPRF